jgi:hypothetical protein
MPAKSVDPLMAPPVFRRFTMNRYWIMLLLLAFPAILLAQNYSNEQQPASYQPAVPPPSMYNAFGGYYSSPGTAAGSALSGMANVISAQGNYNLSSSAAAVNMTQAQQNEIQNAQLYTNAYFQIRATNRAARKAEAGPPPTMEELARIARDGAPRPVTSKEVNPESGQIHWPSVLLQDGFADDRTTLEKIVTKQTKYGGLSFSDQMEARKSIESMFGALKANIAAIPPQDYTTGKSFLNSMIYATCKGQL